MKIQKRKQRKRKISLSLQQRQKTVPVAPTTPTAPPWKWLFPARPTRVFSNNPMYGQEYNYTKWGF